MTKKEILEKAISVVCDDRQNDYGEAEDNFGRIANYWTEYIEGRYEFDSKDVAVMMILLKIARIQSGHHKNDNWIDIAGYAACGGESSESSVKGITYADLANKLGRIV